MDISSAFTRRAGELYAEDVALTEIAERFGTPTYVYAKRAILAAWQAYAGALAGRRALVCYAVKANSNLAVLDLLARAGAGFDIVSGGELARVRAVHADPRRIVFSGVGKTAAEIAQGLDAGVLCFNIESIGELDVIDRIARAHGVRAPISIRVNPDVDPKTHPYISTGLKQNKFGVAYADTLALYRDAAARAGIRVVGIDCHIGSQITAIAPYLETAERLLDLVDRLQAEGIAIDHLDFGGGLGVAYNGETPPGAAELIGALLARVDARGHEGKTVIFEPGRSIVAAAGVLLTRVELVKPGPERNFAIVDAAMNDLIRPTLYQAWMAIEPVGSSAAPVRRYDVVGPVCESGDWLGRDRELAIAVGDLLVVRDAGAYGMTMASNYNTRPRAAEVMVDGGRAICVRRRESVEALFADERILD